MSQAIALISELVKIDHGKYIVKVTATYQEQILGTGLSAEDKIEIAEDNARKRALEVINVHFLPEYPQNSPTNKAQSKSKSIPSTASPMTGNNTAPVTKSTQIRETPQQTPTISQHQTSNIKNSIILPPEEKIPSNGTDNQSRDSLPELSLNSQPSLDSSSNDNNLINTSSDTNNKIIENTIEDTKKPDSFQSVTPELEETNLTDNQNLDLPTEITTEINPDINPEITNQSSNSIEEEEQQTILSFDSETESENADKQEENILQFPAVTNNVEDSNNDVNSNDVNNNNINNDVDLDDDGEIGEEIDFTQIIDETTIEIKRLGWTQEQGRQYLLENYGKKSRHLLSDEELIEFLSYLKSQ